MQTLTGGLPGPSSWRTQRHIDLKTGIPYAIPYVLPDVHRTCEKAVDNPSIYEANPLSFLIEWQCARILGTVL
jgi:hypothetical protein